MTKRIAVLTVLLVVALGAAAGGVYAFDHARSETIAKGVSVNGVDVGGMKVAAARAKVRAALLEPLNRKVVVRHGDQRFVLRPSAAAIGLDVNGSVDKALAASREGGLLSRTWRELRGNRLDQDVSARITYSRPAVRRLVERVSAAVDREPKDATLDLTGGTVNTTPSATGVQVRQTKLRRAITRTLLSTSSQRHAVAVKTTTLEPKVTSSQLASKYPAVLIVHRSSFTLSLYKNLKLARTYSVAIGMQGLETPAGLYHIQNKAVNPAWTEPYSDWVPAADRGKVVPGGSPENPLKARWLGIFNGAGIHGVDPSEYGSIGHAASHGCVRMRIPDVIDLYPQVPVGAPIYIS
jgi:lipoprotein-anchoring transpeptidase ErfK/SrfK